MLGSLRETGERVCRVDGFRIAHRERGVRDNRCAVADGGAEGLELVGVTRTRAQVLDLVALLLGHEMGGVLRASPDPRLGRGPAQDQPVVLVRQRELGHDDLALGAGDDQGE